MFAFYLFLISGFALAVFYGSSGEAINDLVKLQLGTGVSSGERFASGLGLAVSAGMVWALHWRAYRNRLGEVGQSQQGLALVYLFFVSLLLALWGMFQMASVVEMVTELLMGLGQVTAWGLGGQAAKLVLTTLLWLEHVRLLVREVQRGAAAEASVADAA